MISLLAFARINAWDYENDILQLDDRNFDLATKTFPFLFVKFYAPWCHHCKEMTPHLQKIAETLKNQNIVCAEIDAEVNPRVSYIYKIAAYPTLKLFH